MAGMYGADIAQLSQLAAQFDSCASRVEAARVAVGSTVQSSPWQGPDAVRFRGDWQTQHAARLNTVAASLREAATALRRNAEEQEQASAADGGGAAFGGSSATPATMDERFLAIVEGLRRSGTDYYAGIRSFLEQLREGEYAGINPWEIAGMIAKIGEFTDADVGWFGELNTAMDIADIVDGIISGEPDFFDMAHFGADLLGKVPGPVSKLGSVAIHAWTFVGEEASKADFSSETVARNADFIADNPGVVVEEVGKAVFTVGKNLVGWLPL